jgi:acetyl-CoA carboxylase biotin carboxyl carrier protein
VDATLELIARKDAGRVLLCSPAVGLFTRALDRGTPLVPGEAAGTLLRLGRASTLLVPAGASGVIANARPERVHAPVSWGETLYELEPLEGTNERAAAASDAQTEARSGALVLRAPQTGRFYERPAPNEPAFAREGDLLEAGRPVGLVEVMKTFTHVAYRPGGTLPVRARFVRYLVPHASDVSEGQPLCEVAPE